MRIGELAEATGATVRALRYYEEQGLLRPERTASGQRVYTRDDVEQVRWIRTLLKNGLPSRAIAKLSRCASADEVTPEQRAVIYEEHARVEAEYRAIAATKERPDSVLAFIDDGSSRLDRVRVLVEGVRSALVEGERFLELLLGLLPLAEGFAGHGTAGVLGGGGAAAGPHQPVG